MGKAAVAAARAIGYAGAGTVEFIVPTDAGTNFYFIEMNTRLQVEHPVTEAVSGLDLVEWQLRVAAGECLPLGQHDLAVRGHAIEARLYAEDPEREFLPQSGILRRLHLPPPEIARVDTGVREGDAVSRFYDPMIAKIVVWGEDRAVAVRRLRRALAATAILGPRTNLGFLVRAAAHPAFVAGAVDTGFIERYRDLLLSPSPAAPEAALAAAALDRLAARQDAARERARGAADRFTPWARTDGWRLGDRAAQDVVLRYGAGAQEPVIRAVRRDCGWSLTIGEREIAAALERQPDGMCVVTLGGSKRRLRVLADGGEIAVFLDGAGWGFREVEALAPPPGEDLGAGKLTAPMPGKVSALLVEVGSKVSRGQPLVIVEAMKIEHTISAPADGVVAAVRFTVGELVEEGAELITLAPAEGG
jgi:3-methylcrotonyl-CoA carboxylase alpha subunit